MSRFVKDIMITDDVKVADGIHDFVLHSNLLYLLNI